jgi:hypothetical protein
LTANKKKTVHATSGTIFFNFNSHFPDKSLKETDNTWLRKYFMISKPQTKNTLGHCWLKQFKKCAEIISDLLLGISLHILHFDYNSLFFDLKNSVSG